MTAGSGGGTRNTRPGPVVVVLGQPDNSLAAGLRSVGLVPVADDGEVVVWGPRRITPVTAPAPLAATPAGTEGNLLMTIRDAAEALGLGRSTVYELIGRGQLEVVHVGRSVRVPTDAVRSFVESLRSDQGLEGHWQAVG
jgi:excisionase family DNA binding protein